MSQWFIIDITGYAQIRVFEKVGEEAIVFSYNWHTNDFNQFGLNRALNLLQNAKTCKPCFLDISEVSVTLCYMLSTKCCNLLLDRTVVSAVSFLSIALCASLKNASLDWSTSQRDRAKASELIDSSCGRSLILMKRTCRLPVLFDF